MNDSPPSLDQTPPRGFLNLPLPTFGGYQLWTDYRLWAGWRLQQHALTGHWRVLDPGNVRRAWGTREACEGIWELHTVKSDQSPPEVVTVLLHGLMRSSRSMKNLGKCLEAADLGPCLYFEYASTRNSIARHAEALRSVIEHLPGVPRIRFIGHSMGCIVVRRAMGAWLLEDPAGVMPRIESFVMLGPPNQGALIARRLAKVGLFHWITGDGGRELGIAWKDFEASLAIPTCPALILAGDVSKKFPGNPLIDGVPSDFVVKVEEARLPGVPLETVPHLHSFLMDQAEVQQRTVAFLRSAADAVLQLGEHAIDGHAPLL